MQAKQDKGALALVWAKLIFQQRGKIKGCGSFIIYCNCISTVKKKNKTTTTQNVILLTLMYAAAV